MTHSDTAISMNILYKCYSRIDRKSIVISVVSITCQLVINIQINDLHERRDRIKKTKKNNSNIYEMFWG